MLVVVRTMLLTLLWVLLVNWTELIVVSVVVHVLGRSLYPNVLLRWVVNRDKHIISLRATHVWGRRWVVVHLMR